MATTAAAELRHLDADSLEEKLREFKEELFNLRFQAATGQLESHGRLRHVKRDIARIYTIMRERELGIITRSDDDSDDETTSDTTDETTDETTSNDEGAE